MNPIFNSLFYQQKEFKSLCKRIRREFKRVMYIGDIKISEEEYALLKAYMVDTCSLLFRSSTRSSNDPVLATALVQFGIHEYNGSFWPHFKKLFPFNSINQVQCNLIGKIFVYTLKKNNKKCLGYSEMVNSILMHAFITEYYAKDLFDFLFMYYERDLDRNLDNHTKEMRNYLIQSMQREDNGARSYKIKKHTADAVTANEHGCKIRIRRILKMMDDYMFYDKLPENSTNRVTNLFVKWAKQSKDFAYARRKYAGAGRKGRKRFSSPYLHFDTDTKEFLLRFPVQNIPLDDNELDSTITWKISCNDKVEYFEVETEESVTGLKTTKSEIMIKPEEIFSRFTLELVKNGTDVVRRFPIKAEEVRFFDSDWDSVSVYEDYIPSGDRFAFSKGKIECICNSEEDCELCAGLNLYTLYLEDGDVIIYPSGTAKPVGREFEDGLLPHGHVSGAYVIDNDKNCDIYSSAPIICFTAESRQLPGTIIWINNKKYPLAEDNYISFSYTANGNKKGCILKTETFDISEGVFAVALDIPGCRKDYYYEFAIINGFDFSFSGAPYIFKDSGEIVFDSKLKVESSDGEVEMLNNAGKFEIFPDYDELYFTVGDSTNKVDVSVSIPALKWKYDDGEWEVTKPEPIWYQELPNTIQFKYPGDSVTLFMDMPEILDLDIDNEDEYKTSFRRLKGEDAIKCDTTKIRSWLGREDAIRPLQTDFGDRQFIFVSIVTKCIMDKCELKDDIANNTFIVKGNVIGFADCFIDFYRGEEIIAEKVEMRTKGAVIPAELKDGTYTAVFFEQDDEDDDEFGFGEVFLQEFDRKTFKYTNKYNLAGKRVVIKYVSEINKPGSIFAPSKYELSKSYYIDSIVFDPQKPLSYRGIIHSDAKDPGMSVCFSIPNIKQPETIKLCAEQNGRNLFFIYTRNRELKLKSYNEKEDISFNPTLYDFHITVK